jgi:glycosyltransferase involved in cell wall biosynthesis
MRIVIDLQGAQTESRFRGIGRYSLSFTKAIVRNRGDHEIIIALSGLFPDTIEPIRAEFDNLLPHENIRVWYALGPVNEREPTNTWRREAAELIREAFLASLQPDIVYITSLFEGYVDDAIISVGRFDKTTPVCVSLYDLIPLLNPDHYFKHNPAYEKYYQRKVDQLKNSSSLLAISEYSQQEGKAALDQFDASIVNVSTAVDTNFHPLTLSELQAQLIRDKFSLSRSFVLYTGGADERKNLPRLIRAYAKLPSKLRNDHQLVFVGKMPEGNIHQFQHEAKHAGMRTDELVFTGYVTEDELVKLYNLCKLYVFPSWHEGFGLPALEAMSCGAAVIGADTSSLPEVIGNEDALFDPFSEDAILHKITSVLTDEEFRQRLIGYGINRARQFSWDSSANVAIDVFEKMSNSKEIRHKKNSYTASLIKELSKIQTTDQPDDADIAEVAICIDLNIKSTLQYKLIQRSLAWRIEGPFDSSYSLALLNRETALTLGKLGYNVALHSTEGPGDYDPEPVFLDQNPVIKEIYSKSLEMVGDYVDITSRNLYPPRVSDMGSSVQMLHHYAWEESGFPREWVKDFNSHLDGMTCLSSHVQKVMIDNGVYIPMQVSGCGVDHWERITTSPEYKIKAKSFKFLHVSSCFPRKGVDSLLHAYGKLFTSSDDVSLVIKTFPNPHNKIHQWIENEKKNNSSYPHVLVIELDLLDSELRALYETCDVLVSPTHAEGFGLPLAEAMLSGLPVITTAWSGQLDFCNTENSWLVDFEFERAKTHFGLFSSVWAVPKIAALTKAMSEAYHSTSELRMSKALVGRSLLLESFKWGDVVNRHTNAVKDILEAKSSFSPKIAWLSTWNTKCGIASYSEHLIKNLPDQSVTVFAPQYDNLVKNDTDNCVRNWIIGKEHNFLSRVTEEIEIRSLNTIIIQFNYGFYNHQELSDFIEVNVAHGINVLIVLHSTADPKDKLPESNFELRYMLPALKLCHRILVHSVSDLNRLKKIGLIKNVTLFPHGVLGFERNTPALDKTELQLVASYGFCLPHKGLEELVDAAALLRDRGSPIRLRLVNAEHPSPDSTMLVKSIKNRIKKFNLAELVEFNCNYLEDNESLELLADSDLIVFAYQQTGESSSAAVRYGMSTKRPVAVTPLKIFDDTTNATFRLAGTDSESLASGILKTLQSLNSGSEEACNIQENADKWRKEFDYISVGSRLHGLCSALLQQKDY